MIKTLKSLRLIGIFIAALLLSPGARSEETFETFFTIVDPTFRRAGFSTPMELAPAFAARNLISLLSWEHHPQTFPAPVERYNRDHHFANWVDDPFDNTCYDTRAKVLMRSSRRPVQFSASNRCRVETGEWIEPYAARTHLRATDIQIDHVVALKNAYVSGASRWNFMSRCLYANYMGNDFHLLAVDGRENMRKSDRTPADWLPTNPGARCEFMRAWLSIKAIWGLVLSPREAAGIRDLVTRLGCQTNQFILPMDYIAQQRQIIGQSMNLCSRLAPR